MQEVLRQSDSTIPVLERSAFSARALQAADDAARYAQTFSVDMGRELASISISDLPIYLARYAAELRRGVEQGNPLFPIDRFFAERIGYEQFGPDRNDLHAHMLRNGRVRMRVAERRLKRQMQELTLGEMKSVDRITIKALSAMRQDPYTVQVAEGEACWLEALADQYDRFMGDFRQTFRDLDHVEVGAFQPMIEELETNENHFGPNLRLILSSSSLDTKVKIASAPALPKLR